jgi:hypothetical protein
MIFSGKVLHWFSVILGVSFTPVALLEPLTVTYMLPNVEASAFLKMALYLYRRLYRILKRIGVDGNKKAPRDLRNEKRVS